MKTSSASALTAIFSSVVLAPTIAWGADLAPEADGLIFAGTLGIAAGAQYAAETGDTDEFDSDVDIAEGTMFMMAGSGAVSIPLGQMMSLQLDGSNEFYNRADEEEDDANGAGVFGGHLSLRDPGMGLVGIMGGVGQGTSMDSSSGGELGFFLGGEAQAYFGNLTLYGQVGYADFKADDDNPDGEGFVQGWFAGGEGRYFVSEDLMLYGNISYGKTDSYVDGDEPGDAWNWGAGGKMKVSNSMPIYLTADYRGGRYYADDTPEAPDAIGEHTFLAGMSFLFGATTLYDNDRRGATLSSPMLPARASAWTEALD
jgi:hypothetical protein